MHQRVDTYSLHFKLPNRFNFLGYSQSSLSLTMQIECNSATTIYQSSLREHPFIFAQEYLSDFNSLPIKPEFDKYFKDNPEQWNTLMLYSENEALSLDELYLLNPVNKNAKSQISSKETPEPIGRKRLSHYQITVENLPLKKKHAKSAVFTNNINSDNIRSEPKAYKNFTIIPTNQIPLKNNLTASKDPPLLYQSTVFNAYPFYSESFNNNCTISPRSNSAHPPLTTQNDNKSNTRPFYLSRSPSNIDQNNQTTIKYRKTNPVKKREIQRTFCHGAKAIISYFSIGDEGTESVMIKRRKTGSFSEFNYASVGNVP